MPIVIKRYRNRKLYNTLTKQYINLEEIEELLKQEVEVEVVDVVSGRDITAATLSQIIFEIEKNHSGFLPVGLLFSLVQSGGKRLDEIRQNIFQSLNLSHHYDVEIEKRINTLVDSGIYSDKDGKLILDRLLSVGSGNKELFEDIETRMTDYFKQYQLPTKNDLQTLKQRIDALSKQVDNIFDKSSNKTIEEE